ncbi:MAG: tyrosine-type recombinase/integrase [Candidatus Sedimenticola sp. PURPLELP]
MTASKPSRITIRTQGDVEALLPTGKRYRAWDEITKGLCIKVTPRGGKYWWFEYRNNDGQNQSVKLGVAGDHPGALKPGDARKEVKKLGSDPAAAKREEKAAAKAEKKYFDNRQKRILQTYIEGAYWRNHLLQKRSGEATKTRLLHDWSDFLDKPMDEIMPLDVERVRRKRQKKIKPQTVNRSWNDLRALLNCAKRDRVISHAPALSGEIKALKTEEDKRVRWLGQMDQHEDFKDGERDRLMEALDIAPEYLQLITHIALMTGMRRGEIFSLTWGAVDFLHDRITVRAHTAKSAKTRHIPLHADLKARLQQWKEGQGEVKPTDLVVPNSKTGERFVTIKRAWASLLNDALITDFRLHDCRHDFASRLVMRGVDLYAVRDLLGHSSIILTERYAHLAPAAHKAAIEVL